MKRVAIIGGGLSGLSAAYELARDAGIKFTLFEASARLGGIVETVRKDGFTIECGPDSWVTEKPWALDLAKELGLEHEIIPSNDSQRRTYILHQQQLMPMPDGMRLMVPIDLDAIADAQLFGEKSQSAYRLEADRAAELKSFALSHDEDESVATFIRRHFGEEVAHTIAAPLLSGVFGGDINVLSVRAVMPAFVKMEREHGSLINALQFAAHTRPKSVFTTLRSGLGMLIDRIVAILPADSIQLSNPAMVLTLTRQGWSVHTEHSEEIFDAVILATPAHVTRALLGRIDPDFDSALAIEATSAIVIALAFTAKQAEKLKIPDGFGFLVPPDGSEDPQLLACTFVNQKFQHRVPQGGVLLRAFFGGNVAARLLDKSDETLVALTLQALSKILAPLPMPHLTVVRRWPLSLPQYAVGHLARMVHLQSLVARFPGLRLVGNAYYGVGLPDMVRMGREAAKQVQSG